MGYHRLLPDCLLDLEREWLAVQLAFARLRRWWTRAYCQWLLGARVCAGPWEEEGQGWKPRKAAQYHFGLLGNCLDLVWMVRFQRGFDAQRFGKSLYLQTPEYRIRQADMG